MYTHAITRKPGVDFAQGLTTSSLGPPDYRLMLAQHAAYVQELRSLGLEVIELDPLPGYPDAYFVEDTAVVTPEAAVITRPGAETRRGEEQAVAPVLSRYRQLFWLESPATLEGGDVLMAGRHFFIGVSERTNQAGAEQLGAILAGYGYTWVAVPVGEGLHLKSGVNYLGSDTLLVTAQFAGEPAFAGYKQILVDETEAYAANTLWINDCLVTPTGCPNTLEQLYSLGFKVIELDVSEACKMDGGLTCMSLRF